MRRVITRSALCTLPSRGAVMLCACAAAPGVGQHRMLHAVLGESSCMMWETCAHARQNPESESARKKAEADRLRAAEKFMVVGTGEATCAGCGYEYLPKNGDPEYPITPGTPFPVSSQPCRCGRNPWGTDAWPAQRFSRLDQPGHCVTPFLCTFEMALVVPPRPAGERRACLGLQQHVHWPL